MKNEKYERIVSKYKANENRTLNAFMAFLIGGLIGVIGEGLIEFFCYKFHISRSEASSYMMITLIFIASLCTALGFFDKLVNYARCGLLIPITGFAHSMTSAALDYRKEGLVIDEAIYNSHISNEDFYSTVSKLIAQRLIIKRKENEISER